MIKILFLLFIVSPGYAGFFDEHTSGYWWYQNEKPKPQPKDDKNKMSQPIVEAKIKAIKKELKYRKERALLYPTDDNVKSFIVLQNKIYDQATTFSDTWLYVVATNPDLDPTTTFPMSQTGTDIFKAQKIEHEKKLLTTLAKTHGLMFFYKKDCAYCHKMAAIVKNFAKTYSWTLIPISMDGDFLLEFPNSKVDTGQAKSLKIDRFPALIAVDTQAQQALAPIYGFLTQDLLIKRLMVLIKGTTNA